MKKRLSTIMAIVAALSMLFIAGPVMAEQINAEGTETTGHTLTGAVPWEAAWEVGDDVSVLGGVAFTDYHQDFFEKTSAVTVTNFDSNDALYVSIAKGWWTALPAAYVGAKKLGGETPDSDLLVKVQTAVTPGDGTGNNVLRLVANSDSYMALISNGASQNLVEGGDSGVGGIENAGFILDFKVLMDWLTDVPGTYTTNVKMTVTQGAI